MSHTSLRRNYRVYRAIGIEWREKQRFPRLRALYHGWRSWLDGFKVLEWDRRECGCVRLGGGGARYCKAEHLLSSFATEQETPK